MPPTGNGSQVLTWVTHSAIFSVAEARHLGAGKICAIGHTRTRSTLLVKQRFAGDTSRTLRATPHNVATPGSPTRHSPPLDAADFDSLLFGAIKFSWAWFAPGSVAALLKHTMTRIIWLHVLQCCPPCLGPITPIAAVIKDAILPQYLAHLCRRWGTTAFSVDRMDTLILEDLPAYELHGDRCVSSIPMTSFITEISRRRTGRPSCDFACGDVTKSVRVTCP